MGTSSGAVSRQDDALIQVVDAVHNCAPELQYVAIRVLAQVSSACSCERSWSIFDFTRSKKRNRLLPDRARDLVFVFSNLHLVDKVEAADYCETVIEWQERSSSSGEDEGEEDE